MKILLTDVKSILEFLYRKTIGETVELTMDISEADIIIGTSFNKNFYDKTIILTGNKNLDRLDLVRLSKVNKVISRLPLLEVPITYTLDPYKLVKINNLITSNKRNKPISDPSIKDFIITKREDSYYMDSATSYLGYKYKEHPTLVGLLKFNSEKET